VPYRNTEVVGNALGEKFLEFKEGALKEKIFFKFKKDKKIIFCPAATYPHKAIDCLPEIAYEMHKMSYNNIIFRVTLLENSQLWNEIYRKANRLQVESWIENIGPFSYVHAAELYIDSDAVFIPSVLEVFSTSYLEAMSCNKPLLVRDRPFAREICKDAAYYWDKDPKDAAKKLLDILYGEKNKQKMIVTQDKVIAKYGTQEERYEKLKNIVIRAINY